MPVFFERVGSPAARIPLCETTFSIGQDLACHLVVNEEGVGAQHARVGYVHGEYVISSVGDARLWVNGSPTPLLSLKDGDRLSFVPPPSPEAAQFVFRNLLEGAFLPPGTSRVAAALGLKSGGPAGPETYGEGQALGTQGRRVVAPDGSTLVIKRLPPLRPEQDADAWYRVLTSLTGATHPALAACVDGGYVGSAAGAPQRWIATQWVVGLDLRRVLDGDGLSAARAVEVLRTLARGLAHLHARGLVHGDVSPGNVIVNPQGQATLIDFGQTRHWRELGSASTGVVGTPGYLAPEEVLGLENRGRPPSDVYALGALGYALFSGQPPAAGGDVLEVLSRSVQAVPGLRARGLNVPAAVDDVLMAALAVDLESRPSAGQVSATLDQAAVRSWPGA